MPDAAVHLPAHTGRIDRHARQAALFHLAAGMPAPVLAELLGLHPNTAAGGAGLAAADVAVMVSRRCR